MGQKVKNGGQAKLGYRNVREAEPGGGEIRTIAVDDERSPFVRLAFELYATDDYTLADLSDEMSCTTEGCVVGRLPCTRPGKSGSTSCPCCCATAITSGTSPTTERSSTDATNRSSSLAYLTESRPSPRPAPPLRNAAASTTTT